ncbi:hypothetical protein [Neopusillimonas maritima]|uniref:Uncharacterized protein n=1 Tax=Neopusillimonas maritima TaxID=2026239 RepID=A0A3A1YVC3_9BURK|nr:hypothetical protein [Neopusillimonas maritima]RIY41148.1 hypothetical protein CJP73_08360 [Neopusillimonas maritima]|tara:strand:+ start:303 stop:596 length:294 start_codon:yes stop_codon:yes gene_type:complete
MRPALKRQREKEKAIALETELKTYLNGLAKYPDAIDTDEKLLITRQGRQWWVHNLNNPDGFGFSYRTVEEAVRHWKVEITCAWQPERLIGAPGQHIK